MTSRREQGFLLVGVIVMVALVLLVLSVAAPVVAKQLRRDKELEAMHRGQQYTRAIRLYYQKFNTYPTSVKQLEKTNNVRYLRQHYLDPFTGKDDWRLIGFGQAKTTVKGFFGQPLSGVASTGLGSASGLSSGVGANTGSTGGTGAGTTGGGTSDPTGSSGTGSTSSFGSSSFGSGGAGSSSFGSSSGTGGFGQTSTGSGGTGSSQSATGFSGSSGPFVGVGLPKEGESIVVLNEQTDYSKWEFLYDPRIEQLYAKASIFGGGIATQSGGLGSASGLSSTPGTGTNPTTGPTGSSTNSPNSPFGTDSGTTANPNPNPPTAPTTTPQ